MSRIIPKQRSDVNEQAAETWTMLRKHERFFATANSGFVFKSVFYLIFFK